MFFEKLIIRKEFWEKLIFIAMLPGIEWTRTSYPRHCYEGMLFKNHLVEYDCQEENQLQLFSYSIFAWIVTMASCQEILPFYLSVPGVTRVPEPVISEG